MAYEDTATDRTVQHTVQGCKCVI